MITFMCEKLGFPAEATEDLTKTYKKLCENKEAACELNRAVELFSNGTWDFNGPMTKLEAMTGINRFTLDLFLLLLSITDLKEKYKKAEISEDVMWETVEDLRFKLIECKNMHGVWGSFVLGWHRSIFSMNIFKLGRLEYETGKFPFDDFEGIKKDDKVVSIHIPSCGPLLQEDVVASLKKAYEFYKHDYKGDKIPFFCHSWLLYAPMCEAVFPKNSNLYRFYKNFNVIHNDANSVNSDFWRIFYMDFSPENLEKAAEDTTLRRNLKAYLKAGNSMGNGCGLFFFDGEKIINC